MRRIALLAALCLLAGACGDDAATTTDSSATTAASTTTTLLPTTAAATTTGPGTSSTTAEGTTTSTTYGFATFDVPAVDLCVVDHAAGETLNVRSGPGTSYGVVGTLPFDQTAVPATGTAANDAAGKAWKEIDYFGARAWVAAWLLTPSACDVAAPTDYCVTGATCLERVNVRSGPGTSYRKLGTLPYDAVAVQGTGAASADADGRAWQQVRFRGGVGWVASWFLDSAPCSASPGTPCSPPSGAPEAGCVSGWTTPAPGTSQWVDALAQIGVGGPWAEVASADFVVEDMRYCTGPEDADIIAPRPTVERWYIVGYAETDPGFRGRWLVRRTGVGFGLAAVAPYGSTGFGVGIWETCPDGCQVGRPIAGEFCDPACREDYQSPSCVGIAPGTWSPGDCHGLPPEVLACFQ